MAELKGHFSDFMKNIRPTPEERKDLIKGHTTLRDKLHEDTRFQEVIVETFLQGSYRRATALTAGEAKKSDVDIIVVTRLSQNKYTAAQALNHFKDFFEDNYKGNYKLNTRSYAVTLDYVELDVVFTSAPTEAQEKLFKSMAGRSIYSLEEAPGLKFSEHWRGSEFKNDSDFEEFERLTKSETEWKSEPLWIPDRDAKKWERTHPIEQIQWSRDKNAACNSHYVNVVKAIKWWWRHNKTRDYPKGYPVEHIIGDNCDDGIESIAAGVVTSFKNIESNYLKDVQAGKPPFLSDRGVPEHDVLKRLDFKDFQDFYNRAVAARKLSELAFNESDAQKSAELWLKLFGDAFPSPEDDGDRSKGGFSKRTQVSDVGGGRFGRE